LLFVSLGARLTGFVMLSTRNDCRWEGPGSFTPQVTVTELSLVVGIEGTGSLNQILPSRWSSSGQFQWAGDEFEATSRPVLPTRFTT